MTNIHYIDKDSISNLKNMLASNDEGDASLAVEILNNANFQDRQTLDNVIEIVGCNEHITFDYIEYEHTFKFSFYTRKQYEKYLKEKY